MHEISHHPLTFQDLSEIVKNGMKLTLSDTARSKIDACRAYLDEKMANSDDPIYGINTGFGSLCNTKIDRSNLEQLQSNLVMSHACGTGREVPTHLVKLMFLLKIQGLSYGHSGVRIELVERLIWHYNSDVLPPIFEQGSLGASGDLAPLAHLALPLLGRGHVRASGSILRPTAEVLSEHGLEPLVLKSKEGLALLNGTQFMSAYGAHICLEAEKLFQWADLIAAASIEAFDARHEPFKPGVHAVRKQQGQAEVAANIRELLSGSFNFQKPKAHVQDPYSFRCIPQVHGASRDAFKHIRSVFENEMNSVTDNPTVFPEEDKIISAGNFHGQPLAISLDFAAIALAEIGSISERRTYKLVSGERGLPAFLVANPGLNSGYMIPQYTAASIVSRNKQLCTPSSVDSIDSSNGQEDHVSMGANGAVRVLEVLENVKTVLAIELLNAAQAISIRTPEGMAPLVLMLHEAFRKHVSFMAEDRELYADIAAARKFIEVNHPEQWTNS
ncbi:MAG: histidine ammonia-lyase [Cryomorphaceae bacterium]